MSLQKFDQALPVCFLGVLQQFFHHLGWKSCLAFDDRFAVHLPGVKNQEFAVTKTGKRCSQFKDFCRECGPFHVLLKNFHSGKNALEFPGLAWFNHPHRAGAFAHQVHGGVAEQRPAQTAHAFGSDHDQIVVAA